MPKEVGLCQTKTKFNTYASFQVSVTEYVSPIISNIGAWLTGCLIALVMVNLHLISCTPLVNPSLEIERSPVVLIGSTEEALILPNNNFEPQRLRYFYQNVRGLRIK
jgi:hypothetical protein